MASILPADATERKLFCLLICLALAVGITAGLVIGSPIVHHSTRTLVPSPTTCARPAIHEAGFTTPPTASFSPP